MLLFPSFVAMMEVKSCIWPEKIIGDWYRCCRYKAFPQELLGFDRDAPDGFEREIERFRVWLHRVTQVRGQVKLRRLRHAEDSSRQFVCVQQARGKVATSAGTQDVHESEPAHVDCEGGAAEIEKCQAVLREELRAPVHIYIVAARLRGGILLRGHHHQALLEDGLDTQAGARLRRVQ